MAGDKNFQNRIQRIGGLVGDLDQIADPAVRSATRELVQSLMDLHSAGLERMLEIVFGSGEQGARIIDELGRDPLVSSLLVLYGIHPEDLQARVERKLQQMRPAFYKMGAEAKLVSADSGDIRVRVTFEGHVCGSSGRTVQTALEEAIYEVAPDLTSLTVEGTEQPGAAGFVGVEKLLGSASFSGASPLSADQPAQHARGMD
ncbi:MAG TPA: hypothetical protein VMH04_15075 [Candidatus Solibacter sp.]|nr:hypothetical protein [Candidatus Solibacter sp.]